mgnify:CR=1 FL=1
MSAAEYQEIIFEVDEPVATITLNRPEAMNALTVRMLAEIRHAVAAARARRGGQHGEQYDDGEAARHRQSLAKARTSSRSASR